MLARNSICSGRKSRWARSIWRKMWRASMNSTVSSRGRAALAAVEEPERHRQRHRVEEVRADRDHHVDELDPRSACGGSRPRCDAASEAELAITNPARPVVVERGVEELDPEVVAVVGLREPEREARVVVELRLVDAVRR